MGVDGVAERVPADAVDRAPSGRMTPYGHLGG